MAQLRTRVKRSTVAVSGKSKKKVEVNTSALKSLVNKIAEDMMMQEVLSSRIKENTDKLDEKMQASNVRLVEASKGIGEIFTPPTRATNSINVKKFFEKVSRKDFFSVVSVPLGKAKDVLSGKELAKVTITGKTLQKPDGIKITVKKG